MSAMFGIGTAIVSQIFGLPKLAAVDETMGTPLEHYSIDQGTASRNISQPVIRVLTPEEPPHLHSQPANAQDISTSNQNSTTNQDSPSSLRSPSHDSVPDLEAASTSTSTSAVANNDAPEREHPPKTSRLFRSKLLRAGAVLLLGVLPLIVLPGFIMGALTGQILMGIALSSAVATVVGVFAGCYYYIKREG